MTFGRSVVFSGTSVSSTNKTDCHDITEIFLKVALNAINQSNQSWTNIELKKDKIANKYLIES